MSHFQDWNPRNRSDMIPSCNCGCSEVELVDSVLSNGQPGGTLPVWWCPACKKSFSGRGNGAWQAINYNLPSSNYMADINAISGSGGDVSHSRFDDYTVMSQSVERTIERWFNGKDLGTSWSWKNAFSRSMNEEHGPNIMGHVMEEVEKRLKTHMDEVTKIESDPMHEVRKRIAAFKLVTNAI